MTEDVPKGSFNTNAIAGLPPIGGSLRTCMLSIRYTELSSFDSINQQNEHLKNAPEPKECLSIKFQKSHYSYIFFKLKLLILLKLGVATLSAP